MSQPLVSIVLTLYNDEIFIAETIESVKAQSYPKWELIIVDDASTDKSAEIAEKYTEDERIRLIRNEKNGQVSNAHNVGDRECRGAYIAPLDSDDLWDPEKLAKQVEYMDYHRVTAETRQRPRTNKGTTQRIGTDRRECRPDIPYLPT